MSGVVRLKDVAKHAGVGVGTASRVINDNPSVSADKRARVLKAVEELGYRRNAIAHSLKVNRTKTIGVVIPDIANAFYADIVRGAEDVASGNNYNIILCSTDCKTKRELATIAMLREKHVDGVIMITYQMTDNILDALSVENSPVVLVSTFTEHEGVVVVNISNEAAAYDAVTHLIMLGHTRIGMIAGPVSDVDGGLNRLAGYKRALKAHGIAIDETLITYGDYRFDTGYACMRKLLRLEARPSAVFAVSDYMAVGACRAVTEMGLAIPQDMSVIGFDNLDITKYTNPSISTVEQPRYEMGRTAMQLLAEMIHGGKIGVKRRITPHKIIDRESTIKYNRFGIDSTQRG